MHYAKNTLCILILHNLPEDVGLSDDMMVKHRQNNVKYHEIAVLSYQDKTLIVTLLLGRAVMYFR